MTADLSFSKQSYGVKTWLFFQESDVEVKIIGLLFTDLIWPIWGKHYSVCIEANSGRIYGWIKNISLLSIDFKTRISLTKNKSWGREDIGKHLETLKQKYKGNNKDF